MSKLTLCKMMTHLFLDMYNMFCLRVELGTCFNTNSLVPKSAYPNFGTDPAKLGVKGNEFSSVQTYPMMIMWWKDKPTLSFFLCKCISHDEKNVMKDQFPLFSSHVNPDENSMKEQFPLRHQDNNFQGIHISAHSIYNGVCEFPRGSE